MALKTRLTEMLKIQHPIMLAGMGGVSYAEVCAAGERAGLYYTCINSYLTADELAYILDNCRARLLVTSTARLEVARQALQKFRLDAYIEDLGCSLGEELLKPTHIYVPQTLAIGSAGIRPRAIAHITGDGLLNLRRVEAPVGFELTRLPEPCARAPPVEITPSISGSAIQARSWPTMASTSSVTMPPTITSASERSRDARTRTTNPVSPSAILRPSLAVMPRRTG